VLSRKKGEKIMIGEDVVLEIVEVKGNKVRLGISAPEYISIVRDELMEVLAEATQRETKLARAS
jgi:carbon storage regulator